MLLEIRIRFRCIALKAMSTRLLLGSACLLLGACAFDTRCASAQEAVNRAPFKDLDGHFPFVPPASLEAWSLRADELRSQLKVSLGLHPYPKLRPIQPTVHGLRMMDGYSVEKVYFESLPGLFVTGSLYRPLTPSSNPRPAILCPHGHWDNGRFYQAPSGEVKQLLATGAERFESSAKNHMQARCVQLARMGCIVFQWDMLGYADSQQIPIDRAHRFQRPSAEEKTNPDGWVLFSPEAECHAQSVMGLQTINTFRCVDFVTSLPDVDKSRVAITGASGGGTQAFVAAALDERIKVVFPAVMVSTGMQGGCTCENACGLRVHTGNVEIAALIAPRPLGMTAANDWTRSMPQDGFPELKKVFALFGKESNVALFPSLHFGHNYNHVSRVSMYGWINRHFHLGLDEPILERDFECLDGGQLTVWDAAHPAPQGGLDFERSLLRNWKKDTDMQLRAIALDASADSTAVKTEANRKVAEGWDALLRPALPHPINPYANVSRPIAALAQTNNNKLDSIVREVEEIADSVVTGVLSRHKSFLSESNESAGKKSFVWIGGNDEPAIEFVQQCKREEGELYIASFSFRSLLENNPGPVIDPLKQPLVKNPRLSAAYTYGYNPPMLLRKSAVAVGLVQQLVAKKSEVSLGGQGTNAFIAAACAKLAKDHVKSVFIWDDGFRLAQADAIDHSDFFPSGLRYLDLPGLVSTLDVKGVQIKDARDGPLKDDWSIVQQR